MLYLLNVSVEFLFAAARPVVAVESSLNEGGHDAAHARLVSTAVPLAIVLHPQTGPNTATRQRDTVSCKTYTSTVIKAHTVTHLSLKTVSHFTRFLQTVIHKVPRQNVENFTMIWFQREHYCVYIYVCQASLIGPVIKTQLHFGSICYLYQ